MAASRSRRLPDLLSRVDSFLRSHVRAGEPLVVGLSGGCDSLVLLHLVVGVAGGSAVSAIHVHHGLSPNADDWLEFCQKQCAGLNVPLICRRVAVDRVSGQGIEAAARSARYEAFVDALPAGSALLLAQHRGDQAETLLFNLFRGCGLSGAAAIRPQRYHHGLRILRPLLSTARAEIECWARAHQLDWIDDESNDDRRFSRNFLRHEVMPAICQRFPAAEASLARAAGAFAEASDLLDEMAAADWLLVQHGESARMSMLRKLSTPRLKNLLRWRLRCLNWQAPVAARLEEFVRQLQKAGPDRHPELVLPTGKMRVAAGLLHWVSRG